MDEAVTVAIDPSLTSTTVLFIDPHKEDREYWTQRLKQSGYVVLETQSGAEALAIFRSQRIDCVIVELLLPDMSGFELLLQLVPLASRPEVPVVFLSRLNLEPMIQLARNNGAQAFLVKSRASGDDLDKAILKALAAVGPRKERPF